MYEKRKKGRPVHTISKSSESCEDIMTYSNRHQREPREEASERSTQQKLTSLCRDVVAEKTVNFQIDGGAICNVIPIPLLNQNIHLDNKKYWVCTTKVNYVHLENIKSN